MLTTNQRFSALAKDTPSPSHVTPRGLTLSQRFSIPQFSPARSATAAGNEDGSADGTAGAGCQLGAMQGTSTPSRAKWPQPKGPPMLSDSGRSTLAFLDAAEERARDVLAVNKRAVRAETSLRKLKKEKASSDSAVLSSSGSLRFKHKTKHKESRSARATSTHVTPRTARPKGKYRGGALDLQPWNLATDVTVEKSSNIWDEHMTRHSHKTRRKSRPQTTVPEPFRLSFQGPLTLNPHSDGLQDPQDPTSWEASLRLSASLSSNRGISPSKKLRRQSKPVANINIRPASAPLQATAHTSPARVMSQAAKRYHEGYQQLLKQAIQRYTEERDGTRADKERKEVQERKERERKEAQEKREREQIEQVEIARMKAEEQKERDERKRVQKEERERKEREEREQKQERERRESERRKKTERLLKTQ